ncbi:hypothetical protein CYMTET_39106 [Cymbomonas tetramitiformis]|uniref:B12-binding domain-containing protein n=1 Tax=Cymbomonas tetramitiformis TaxID=36881 RepID=A0AAE0CCY5_9CHLO|nr:hypothetical protein CYMTET_39106 [Cymbomonas tetramitiformis]
MGDVEELLVPGGMTHGRESAWQVIVGVNKFRLDKEEPLATRSIDNAAVLQQQVEQLRRIRESRDGVLFSFCRCSYLAGFAQTLRGQGAGGGLGGRLGAEDHCMGGFGCAAKAAPMSQKESPNLLELAVEAARRRCTVGEISDALEFGGWGRYVPTDSVISGVYGQAYGEDAADIQSAMAEVRVFEERAGRRPRVLVAKMGQDGHDRGAKVIATGLADLGFDVDIGPLFQTPEEVARQAVDADVHCVGVSSQAAGHRTLVPQLRKALQDAGVGHVLLVIGGVIPQEDYQFLYDNGVGCIFGPGTRIPAAAKEMLAKLPLN